VDLVTDGCGSAFIVWDGCDCAFGSLRIGSGEFESWWDWIGQRVEGNLTSGLECTILVSK